MKKKILPQDLSDAIARNEKINKAKAETFVRAYFETIETGLLTERFVKIKGFGTFKLVEVNERESVDVNTGERIRISGHTKVSFVPETKMKDLVNRPFAHFESVDLNEDTDPAEFEKIDRETAELFQIPTSEEEEENDFVEDFPTKIPTHVPIEREDVPTPEEQGYEQEEVPSEEPEDEQDEVPSEEPEDEQDEVPSEEPGDKVDEVPSEELGDEQNEVPSEEPGDEQNEVPSEETGDKVDEVPSEETGDEQDEVPSEETGDEGDEYLDDSTSNSMEYTYNEVPSRRKHNWWKFTAITLIVLILMGLSYFAGYFRLLCPPCQFPGIFAPNVEQPANKVAPPTKHGKTNARPVEKASAKPEVNPSSNLNEQEKALPEAQTKQEKSKSETADKPQMVYHTIQKGENLTRIVRKYYGSDEYVRMVVKHNKLKDPNNIPIGFTLELPME